MSDYRMCSLNRMCSLDRTCSLVKTDERQDDANERLPAAHAPPAQERAGAAGMLVLIGLF